MKFTYNWLKDFVEIKIPPKALADKLTMAGLEVTGLEEKSGDFVFEVEITSNRPDWLSVYGLAREVAALTNKKLRPEVRKGRVQGLRLKAQGVDIKIENQKDCSFYGAAIIQDVKIGPSPDWLKKRLELIGCRSINNAVDITNYILFTSGQPLHAFDLDKLNGRAITVRRARAEEKIVTIDAEERLLSPDTLVIADTKGPVALAGIMGGKDTEVGPKTKNILLEAASFNPLLVRRGRQKLGLQSDSAYRFERGVDMAAILTSAQKAAYLIEEICSGKRISFKSQGKIDTQKRVIKLNCAGACAVLGVDIPGGKIKQILSNLGFAVKQSGQGIFAVNIPSWRRDVTLEMDLIEEIGRIYGYADIPASLPKFSPQPAIYSISSFIGSLKDKLTGLGLNEVITYSLTDKETLKSTAASPDEFVAVANPLSAEQQVLRPTLMPALLRSVALNLNQKEPYAYIFEIAKIFRKGQNGPEEEWAMGICLCGARALLLEQGLIKDPAGFLHLKGILEVIFRRSGIRDFSFAASQDPRQVDILCGKEKAGSLLKPGKSSLESAGIKNAECFCAEVRLERFFARADLEKKFIPLPLYPGISRDISVIVKDGVRAGDLLQAVRQEDAGLLASAAVSDYYQGKQIPAGFKGLTISCLYRSDKRTLTEAEVNPLHQRISKALTEKFSAQLR